MSYCNKDWTYSDPAKVNYIIRPGLSYLTFLLQKKKDISTFLCVQSTTVSFAGLPVLRTLYEPMSMHKSPNSQNCEFCVL